MLLIIINRFNQGNWILSFMNHFLFGARIDSAPFSNEVGFLALIVVWN